MKNRISSKRNIFFWAPIILVLLLFLSFVYFSIFKKPEPYPGDSNQLYWKIRLYKDQTYVFFRDIFKPESGLNKTIKNVVQLPKQEKKFKSKLIDLNLTVPAEYYFNSKNEKDYEILTAGKDGENKLSMTIYPATQGCIGPVESGNYNGRWDPLRLKIGGKYPIAFSHWSISHGDPGHTYGGIAPADNDYCIAVTLNINIMNEREFVKILEGNSI